MIPIFGYELNIPVFVEKDLHEWDSDRIHTIKDGEKLFKLCKKFNI